jgi:hypothetical protein
VLLAVLLVVALAAPAQAGVVSPEDAAELAQTLAEAQDEQGVCYGWNVTNNFSASSDVGSSTSGPGVALVPVRSTCPKGAVILEGDIDYACESCESSDSASVSIASSLANPPTVDDLKGLGLKAGDLTGDNDDTTLVNMVNALPLLVADRGNAPYVPYEPAKTVPAADHATDKPGSDLLRDTWIQLVLFGGLIVAGPGFYFYKRGQRPKSSAPPPVARLDFAAEPERPVQPWPEPGLAAEPDPPAEPDRPVQPWPEPGLAAEPEPPAEPEAPPPPSTPPPSST